jgi:hypothetical protein
MLTYNITGDELFFYRFEERDIRVCAAAVEIYKAEM